MSWFQPMMKIKFLQYIYRSVPGKRPLPGKRPCIEFQGVTVAASIQTYGIFIPGKRPCGPKSRVMFKCPWALTRDTSMRYYSFSDQNWYWSTYATQNISCMCLIFVRKGRRWKINDENFAIYSICCEMCKNSAANQNAYTFTKVGHSMFVWSCSKLTPFVL